MQMSCIFQNEIRLPAIRVQVQVQFSSKKKELSPFTRLWPTEGVNE